MTGRRLLALLALAAVAAGALLLVLRGGDDPADPLERPAGGATRAQGIATGGDGQSFALLERLEDGRWTNAVAPVASDGSLARILTGVPLVRPAAIAVRADGAVLVAGDRIEAGRRRIAVVRVTPGGRVDSSFGRGGVASVAAGTGDALARGVAVDASGGVVAVGDARDGDSHALAIARFDGSGRRPRVDLVRDADAAGVASARDGPVVAAGTDTEDGAAVLVRMRPRGSLRTRRVRTRLTSARWRAVTLMPDGAAVVAGSGRGSGARSLVALLRLGSDGAVATSGIPAGDGDAYGVAVAAGRDGRVRVAADGVHADRPAAFLLEAGEELRPPAGPERRGPGRVAGLAGDGSILATAWVDGRQQARLLR